MNPQNRFLSPVALLKSRGNMVLTKVYPIRNSDGAENPENPPLLYASVRQTHATEKMF